MKHYTNKQSVYGN